MINSEKNYLVRLSLCLGEVRFWVKSSEEGFSVLMQGTGDEFETIIFNLLHSYLVKCFGIRARGSKPVYTRILHEGRYWACTFYVLSLSLSVFLFCSVDSRGSVHSIL